MIGAWKNWAKLGITTRLAYYYLHNTENAQNVSLNGVASRVRTLEEEGVSSGYGDVPPGRIELWVVRGDWEPQARDWGMCSGYGLFHERACC